MFIFFQYDGEIRVLYSTKVASSITSKKWGARDLQIKPGESLEVIQSTDDTKVLCRNEEGKCKSLLKPHCASNNHGLQRSPTSTNSVCSVVRGL